MEKSTNKEKRKTRKTLLWDTSKNQPPTFTLFVNDPKLFGITYRRYIEKQIRLNLGFEGSPIILLWRGKQQRDLEKETSKKNINIIQKD